MVALSERKHEILTRRAKAQQGTRTDLSADLPKSLEPIDTRDVLAREVGVGARTYDKLRAVTQTGIPELVQADPPRHNPHQPTAAPPGGAQPVPDRGWAGG